MALDLPSVDDVFKPSPEDGQIFKSYGNKEIPEDDNDTQTKEFFYPQYYSLFGGGNTKYMGFKIPYDFTSITSAVMVFYADGTDAASNYDIYSWYGQAGENYNNHSESDTATTYNITQNKIAEIDISGILTNLLAGDYVKFGIKVNAGEPNIVFYGIKLRYT